MEDSSCTWTNKLPLLLGATEYTRPAIRAKRYEVKTLAVNLSRLAQVGTSTQYQDCIPSKKAVGMGNPGNEWHAAVAGLSGMQGLWLGRERLHGEDEHNDESYARSWPSVSCGE